MGVEPKMKMNSFTNIYILGAGLIIGGILVISYKNSRSRRAGLAAWFDKHFSDKANRVYNLVMGIIMILFGIGIFIWQLFFK